MSALAAPLERVRRVVGARQRIAIGLLGLLVLSFALRYTAIHARYWIDEGLSVGIAEHPLADIPGLLRQDGAPPLYYLLLGIWTRLFGDGEARTHALSLGFALLTVPVGFAAARSLFSDRAAWFTAIIAALIPFLSFYAQETRMYSLVVLLSMTVAASHAMVFVMGRPRWLGVFVVSGAALLYTHNWGLFLMAGSAIALVPLLRARTVAPRHALIGYGGIAVLYLPWLPTLIYQASHTGAPWSTSPALRDLPTALSDAAGGLGPAVAILLAGGTGLAAYRAMGRGPGDPRSQEAMIVRTIGFMVLVALVLAFVSSQVSPGWTLRYFAVLIGPLILVVGAVLAQAGNLGLVTLALLAVLWLHPPTAKVNNKSDVHHVASLLKGRVAPGDIVVSTHPEQVPVEHFYFPAGLRWASGMGWVPDTRVMDWRNALERYRRARVRPTADRFVRALRPGQQLLLVVPIIRTASWNAPWTRLVRRRSKQWEQALDSDSRLSRDSAIPHLGDRGLPRGVRVVLYSLRPPAARAR